MIRSTTGRIRRKEFITQTELLSIVPVCWNICLCILVGLLLLLAMVSTVISYFPKQPAHAAASDWTTFQGSNSRTGYNAGETTINTTTAPNLNLHWTFSNPAHAQITAQVIADNGMLYWGDWNGVLHASDPATGKDVWKTSLATRPGFKLSLKNA